MKPTTMTSEVRAMIDLRHSAEQRGQVSPLGRLLCLDTEHGVIQFPAERGDGTGPDIGVVSGDVKDDGRALVVFGEWLGLPNLRVNMSVPCRHCLHLCDVCGGSKKKLCELCGGRAWMPGKFLPCPGLGCSGETRNFKADCGTCGGSGQIREQVACSMCGGRKASDPVARERFGDFSVIVCTRCRGTGKYSTGRINGSIDWDGPSCTHCRGACWRFKLEKQRVEKFANARLRENQGEWLALGPVYSFAVRDFEQSRTIIYDITADAVGDFMMLLVPASARQKPHKAYLVGGVVALSRRSQRSQVPA